MENMNTQCLYCKKKGREKITWYWFILPILTFLAGAYIGFSPMLPVEW